MSLEVFQFDDKGYGVWDTDEPGWPDCEPIGPYFISKRDAEKWASDRAMYLDYVNNFLSLDGFANHYFISKEEAIRIIEAGRL